MLLNTTLPTRPIEELRTLQYADMNSAEIQKFEREDPEAYKTMVTALDAPAAPPVAEGETPAPVPVRGRTIYRNGVEVDTSAAIRYVNGIPQ